ncbi:MAG: hypothetical protein QNJ94_05665 [Alphaproteobacteria bacterium]|nr:hypothetical protein [Alphaproteobacteria bacterium]
MSGAETNRGQGPVSLNRVRRILEAYGAAPATWPAAERAAVLAALADDEDARRLWHEAAALDAALAGLAPPPPTEALRRQVIEAAQASLPKSQDGLWTGLRPPPVPRLAALAAVAAGAFLLGLWLSPQVVQVDLDQTALPGRAPLAAASDMGDALAALPLVDPDLPDMADEDGIRRSAGLLQMATIATDGAASQALTGLALE